MNTIYKKAINLLLVSTETMILSSIKIALATPTQPLERCATPAVHQHLLATDPVYRENRQRLESEVKKYVQERVARTGIARIPVVVHVVYNTNTLSQNISEAQINSQIAILNKDFRKLNADVAGVPDVFAPLATDARIEFVLACRDPNGNATTGITRTATTVVGFSPDDDAVKFTAQGGRDAWPANKYLNIWVADISGGILGHAQFPGGNAATDGVVIRYNAFGNQGTAAAPFNLGRTTTHEVGHWLNLYHIWGDDGGACDGSDKVEDTPNQGNSNYNVPDFPTISCNNEPNGDMFMNYMDYVDDIAMFMFSSGQSVRMDAALTLDPTRAAVLSSTAAQCAATLPTVTTSVPSVITATSARLNGTVNPKGAATTVTFDFGLNNTYGQNFVATPASIAATAAATNVSANKTGLTCGTTYNYRVKATNSVGTTNGANKTFTTSVCSRDLEITSLGITPTVAPTGQSLTVRATIKNHGTTNSNGGTLSLWLDRNSTANCNAASDKTLTVGTIAAGASKTFVVTDFVATTGGSKFLRAFVDSACALTEVNENNNQMVKAYWVGMPDLAVTSISLNPAVPATGSTFTAQVTIKNNGTSPVTRTSFLDLWLNQPTNQSCGAAGDVWEEINDLAAGASQTITFTGLTAGTAGTKTMRAYADSWCERVDANRSNNQVIKSYTVQ